MRASVFYIIALLVLSPAFSAYAADYSNDSDSININYTGGTPTSPDTSSGQSDQSGQGSSGSGAGGTNIDAAQAASTDPTVPVIAVTSSGGGNSGGGIFGGANETQNLGGSTGTGGAGGSSGTSALNAQDILNTLQGNQAVVFGTGVSSGGAGGGGSAEDAFGVVTLSGKKVREALSARGVSEIILRLSLGQRYQTKGDATIAAASAILKNSALEEVVLSLRTLSFTYTAQGRLFAVFPIDYPLKVAINPGGASADERVRLGFPWYSFFLQTFVSKKKLQADINASVLGVVSASDGGVDAQSRLVSAVNETLQKDLVH